MYFASGMTIRNHVVPTDWRIGRCHLRICVGFLRDFVFPSKLTKMKCCLLLLLVAGCTVRSHMDPQWNEDMEETQRRKPNIILFMVDDMGFDDVGFHGSTQIPTPRIDRLAREGIILNRFYSQSTCTPSRTALMTGKYPFTLGMQETIKPGEPWGLPLNNKLLPQYLKDLGYSTHMIGKWHLGEHHKNYLPTNRGFDSFLGTPGGVLDYYNYTIKNGYSFYNGTAPLRDIPSTYVTDLFASYAEQLIVSRKDNDQPFFLYFAPNAPRASLSRQDPYQTAPHYIERPAVQQIANPARRKYAAMVQAVDDALGRIHDTVLRLKQEDYTAIWFLSDNGGPQTQPGTYGSAASTSNWPLRGCKATLFEGGIRVPAVFWSPVHAIFGGRISDQLLHITDLFPMVLSLAGANDTFLHEQLDVDGKDSLGAIRLGFPGNMSMRLEIPLEINYGTGDYGLIQGQYKILKGNFFNGSAQANKWTRPPGVTGMSPQRVPAPATVNCKYAEGEEQTPCNPAAEPCLFDLEDDPCETNNLASRHPEVVASMLEHLFTKYNSSYVAPSTRPEDPASNPNLHGGLWVPWT